MTILNEATAVSTRKAIVTCGLKSTTFIGAMLVGTTFATAGGLDRSGQGVTVVFEDGDYAELSYGAVNPNVSGVFPLNGAVSGDILPNFGQVGMALKMQMNEQFSLALIYDQPFGADVAYETPGYPITGAFATVESDGVTALARFEINPSFSVHGGLRYVQANGVYNAPLPAPFPPGTFYNSTYSQGEGTGYVIGGAYERDDIALRIAVTYSSEIDLDLPGTSGDLSTTLPESVNLDFQTGIAADTLLFGSVRYVAWDGFALRDSTPGIDNILSYDDDVYTYNIGIGRRITEALSASFAIGYENPADTPPTGQLGPTDGYISYSIGAAYALDNGVEISGGIRYLDFGDTDTNPIAFGSGGLFENNDAVALGLKVAYTF